MKVEIDIYELADLKRKAYKLALLECYGVDNWECYDYALDNEEGEYDDTESYHDFCEKSDEELTKAYQDEYWDDCII